MPNKVKIFFAFLAVLAVVSVLSFFDVLGGVKSALIGDNIVPLAVDLAHDADNDGLSDTDESYWLTDFENPDTDGDGYLDGEEVASRHNPTVAGPYDKLTDLNLTQRVADLAASGLVEGSLKPNSPNYITSLDNVALAVIDDGLKTFISYPEDLKLNLIEDTPNNNQEYIEAISQVWEQFFKTFGNEINNLDENLELTNKDGYFNQENITFFTQKRNEFSVIATNWQSILVPKNWESEHTNFLNLIQEMTKINEAIAEGVNDPLRATMGLTLLINVAEQIPEIIKVYSDKVSLEKIQSNLFK